MPYHDYGSGGSGTSGSKPYLIGGIAAFLLVVAFIGGCNYFSSYDAPRPGYSAVCQTGGPIEGDSGTCGFLSRGSGKRMIGYENKLVEFPATQRTLLFADNKQGDGPARGADAPAIEVPLADGNVVHLRTQVQFTLNQDQRSQIAFYKAYGTRTFGGPSATDDPDGWFVSWEQNQMLPTIEGAYREVIAPYRCGDVNPSCDLDKLNQQLQQVKNKDTSQVDPTQESQKGKAAAANLATVASAVQKQLAGDPAAADPALKNGDLATALNGDYITGIRVKVFKADPPREVSGEIQKANAAKARLVTAIANGQAKVQEETAKADAAEQTARGRRALSKAYTQNSALAQIEIAKALCGSEGCQNLQVLGGGSNLLTQLQKGN